MNTSSQKKLLFVNGCVRGADISRTQKIADSFLNRIERVYPSAEITEKNLMLMNPLFMNYFNFKQREELINAGKFDHWMFDLAREFAAADAVVIAAPFWELSFPAILRVYLENVSVPGISFKYTDTGSVGLCAAEKMLFITTRGGDYSKPPLSEMEFGASFLQALCKIYGIDDFECLSADGLDIWGADAQAIVAQACTRGEALAESFF